MNTSAHSFEEERRVGISQEDSVKVDLRVNRDTSALTLDVERRVKGNSQTCEGR